MRTVLFLLARLSGKSWKSLRLQCTSESMFSLSLKGSRLRTTKPAPFVSDQILCYHCQQKTCCLVLDEHVAQISVYMGVLRMNMGCGSRSSSQLDVMTNDKKNVITVATCKQKTEV